MDTQLINALHRMIELQEQILSELQLRLPSLAQPAKDRMTRQQVKDYLNISESTYKRKVKDGTLKPAKMPGGDSFLRSDLDSAFRESIRRGRI
ncbi:MAG: DNA-binding protein [Pedobacter sp.]|nr:DNA-binding protein [Pedobacter sp.]